MIEFTKLGAVHEEDPQGFKLGQIQVPVAGIPDQYLCNDDGPLVTDLPILMQGQSPECGGFSLATLINFCKKAGASLSGSFTYAFEKTVDGLPTIQGTLISAVGKAGAQAGSCLDTLFPDDGAGNTFVENPIFSTASPEAVADGKTRLMGTPFLLDDLSIAGIQQALYQNGAVILEVQVGKEWWTAANGATSWNAEDILPIRPPATVIDSHFICVIPYDQKNDRLWFPNTWSTEWGKNGWGYLQSNYAPFIKAGIAFKNIPPSVFKALTMGQIEIAQQILSDFSAVLKDIAAEAKVATQ
jgi:hypothetical protein